MPQVLDQQDAGLEFLTGSRKITGYMKATEPEFSLEIGTLENPIITEIGTKIAQNSGTMKEGGMMKFVDLQENLSVKKFKLILFC